MLTMQQLNPKASWYFFCMFVARASAFFLFLGYFWIYELFNPDLVAVEPMATLLRITPLLIVVVILFSWFWSRLSYANYKYELKDEGVRIERGVISKKYVTIPYDRIQNVDILRGVTARVLGLSDLQIQTAGEVTAGSYGAYSEGRLPGLCPDIAEQLRDEVLRVSKKSRGTSQGL